MAKGDLIRARAEYNAESKAKTKKAATQTAAQRRLIESSVGAVGAELMATEDFQREFCELLSGGSTIKAALSVYNLNYAKYYHYRKKDPEFAKMVDTAVDVGFDAIADECIAIADKPAMSKIEVMQAKLRIETRIEILQRKSRRYNTRQQIEVTDTREIDKAMRERFTTRIDAAKAAKKSLS